MASTEVEHEQKYKRIVLRVSIHCKGCERKVKKLIQSLPGVHDIEIEIKQQRVVVTGDVSPETLIRKLVKSGKHAELWPEKEKPPEVHTRKIEKEKPLANEESVVSEKEIKPPASKPEASVEDPSKNSSGTVSGGGVSAGSGAGKVDEGEKVAVEVKVEEKKPETGSEGKQATPPVVEKKEEENKTDGVMGGGGGGGGEGKKKKKKKSQNINKNVSGETSSSAPPSVIGGGGGPLPTRHPSNESPPRHYGYQYPPRHHYTPPPAPVYTVSYNTANPPVNSYTASYYAPPPPQSQSYAYSHYGSEMEHQQPQYLPSHYDSYRQQPSDSFEMFSDENPNGCLVM